MNRDAEEQFEVIQGEAVDVSRVPANLRDFYGDGVPMRTYKMANGATVRIFGTALPQTKEENDRRLAAAWAMADRIAENIARRAYEATKEENANEAEHVLSGHGNEADDHCAEWG